MKTGSTSSMPTSPFSGDDDALDQDLVTAFRAQPVARRTDAQVDDAARLFVRATQERIAVRAKRRRLHSALLVPAVILACVAVFAAGRFGAAHLRSAPTPPAPPPPPAGAHNDSVHDAAHDSVHDSAHDSAHDNLDDDVQRDAPVTGEALGGARARMNEGLALLARRAFDGAAAVFAAEAGRAGSPFLEEAAFWEAMSLARAGKRADAQPRLTAFVARFPSSTHRLEAESVLGWLLLEGGDVAGARGAFEEAQRSDDARVRASAMKGLQSLGAR